MKRIEMIVLIVLSFIAPHATAQTTSPTTGPANPTVLFSASNLTAWCVVPFDAKKRGPEERAAMLQHLGFRRFAYDWRDKDVPTFDAEVEAMKRHGVNIDAWWFPTDPNAAVSKTILEVCKRHDIHPQLWVMGGGSATKTPEEQAQRIEVEAQRIAGIVALAAPYGCRVELYNHDNWFGQTDNEIAVIERLKQKGIADVGMVYNFSHGHGDIDDFPAKWKRMKSYVVAVNVSGMTKSEKMIPPSQGDHELAMLRVIQQSGWTGPIGLIAEQGGDAEVTLGNGLRGLEWLGKELSKAGSGGDRPKLGPVEHAPTPGAIHETRLVPGRFAKALDAKYIPERDPLEPANHPLWKAPVNRDRIYDFYAKEARDFAGVPEKPAAIPSFPGLDSAKYGHWGNQNESTWESDVWSHMDIGTLQAGNLSEGGRMIPRAVCVKVGDAAACFDPDRLNWPRAWHGGFVKFSSARFGFLAGLQPSGVIDPPPEGEPARPGAFVYHGFYRHGPGVIVSYQQEGVEWLESPSLDHGRIVITRERADTGKLAALVHGGPPRWPQTFETVVVPGTGKPYAIDDIALPERTPWNSLFHFGGLDFLPNGDAALCTFEGEVWIVSGIGNSSGRVTWRRFAAGLHQPLGLCVVKGKICVLGRDQITRLHDLNNDGEADYYECYCRAYQTPTGGHDFVTGLKRDAEGHFYLVSGLQGLLRTSNDLKTINVLGTGFRNPNGVGLGPNGQVAVAVQEGDWTPASMVYEITPEPGVSPGHYGYGGPRPGPRGHLPPLAYLPRGEDNSCGGQCYVEGDRWGIPAGNLIHFSWGTGRAFLILRQSLNGVGQGTVVTLPGEFRSGAHRGQFSPFDGQLYVAGMTGWGTYTPYPGCFQRMRYTGGPAQLPRATEAYDNGILIRFAKPLDKASAENAAAYFAQEWNYRYSAAYGSDEYSVRAPELSGHDRLKITSAHVLAEGCSLFLEIPQLLPANNLHLHCNLPGLATRDFFFTLHQLDPAFTQFPGYRPIDKIPFDPHAAHQMMAMAPGNAPRPVEWERGPAGRPLQIQSAGGLQFEQKELRAKAGERLSLTFNNVDQMPHNWVLVKPGTADKIGALADRLITEPDVLARNYVPDSPDILCHTRIIDPQKSMTIHFTAPTQPGRYPYLCTFPGHWVLMRGVLIVE